MTTTTTLTGLSTTIYAAEGFDEVLIQVGAVTGECFIVGGKVVKVLAADGVVFAGKGTTLIRPDGYDVTDLCDLDKLARQIKDEADERRYDRIARRVMDRAMAQLPELTRATA